MKKTFFPTGNRTSNCSARSVLITQNTLFRLLLLGSYTILFSYFQIRGFRSSTSFTHMYRIR